ncbi:hypothetical protein Athai_10930 [Actinocatenispora thailandica]|uniref:Uncharacterized protein n=1 Tax=Actinocatenispora thailandica TaxID=227318 RepID=A0A7R7DL84_9ACTN|nr:hypothetical protein Athai_10930 [Actinocatenispora thailandica]
MALRRGGVSPSSRIPPVPAASRSASEDAAGPGPATGPDPGPSPATGPGTGSGSGLGPATGSGPGTGSGDAGAGGAAGLAGRVAAGRAGCGGVVMADTLPIRFGKIICPDRSALPVRA